MLIILTLLLPLLSAAMICLIKSDSSRHSMCAISLFVCAATAVLCCLYCQGESVCLYRISEMLSISFRMDELGAFFIILVSLIWCFVQFNAFVYMSHEGNEARFFFFYILSYAALIALAMAANAVTLYMCFELMTLFSMPMVLHNGSGISRKAAMKYLSYSSVGAATALMGFFIISGYIPGLEFVPGGHAIEKSGAVLASAFLVTVGFGSKAGLVPMQLWLTEAHPVAPSPASAVLSGIITKGGIIAIIRCLFFLLSPGLVRGTWVQSVLAAMAVLTVFTGSMLALRESKLKKRLAYSSVSQLSYVLFGLFTFNAAGFCGALLQMVFHALAKDVLFLAAGILIFRFGISRVDELRGLGSKLPLCFICFSVAALSLIGIPPTGGFVSKWYLAMGGLGLGALGTVGVVVLMISALLTAFYLMPIVSSAFFPGKEFVPEKDAKKENPAMLLPLAVFSALILVFGMLPSSMLGFFERLAAVLAGGV